MERRNVNRQVVKDDWELFISQGWKWVLSTACPHMSVTDRDNFTLELTGLANWCEDECLLGMFLAIRSGGI